MVVHSVSEQGLRTVRVAQRVGDTDVFGSSVTVAVGSDNGVLAVAGQLFRGADAAAGAGARALAATDASVAIAAAVADLTGEGVEASAFEPDGPLEDAAGHYRSYRAAARPDRPLLGRPVRLKNVLFPFGAGEFVPGFYMELWIEGLPLFGYVVSADETPAVLYRKNLQEDAFFTYLVHNTLDVLRRPHDSPAPGSPHPTGTPNGFQAPVRAEQPVTVESLLPGRIERQWLSAADTTTQGNNCFAYADITSPDGFNQGDVPGQTTGIREFRRAYDPARPANDPGNVQASVVEMFFLVNWVHDRWYVHGFDEAAGNAQRFNFDGAGGIEGDPILAEGNDFSGTNNANMQTPADGASPRMQMFLFTGPNPSRTSNNDAQVVIHELGHYITNRLVGNASGLTNRQGRAMGEGWGDIFALCMTSQATDDFANGCFAMGAWVTRALQAGFADNYYFGIRRYPYSARLEVNPLTFGHIAASVALPAGPPITPLPFSRNPNNEVHNAGEVWAAALWQVFVNLVDRHEHTDAERRMLRYVIGGLELTPPQPTFVQARNAIITAVSQVDPSDLRRVWGGFATRGLGVNAVAPPANSVDLVGATDDFTVPNGLPPDDRIADMCAGVLLL